jgi:hypothetical protein
LLTVHSIYRITYPLFKGANGFALNLWNSNGMIVRIRLRAVSLNVR